MSVFYRYFLLFCMACIFISCAASKKKGSTGTGNKVNGGSNELLSQKFGVTVPATANTKLADEIGNWMGTPYKLGGSTKAGVDCSGFICQVFPVVYNLHPPRTKGERYKMAKPVLMHEIQEGDIVFFTIGNTKPSHSGIYLWNGYFVHASTSKGVILSNLVEVYWANCFTGAGRLSIAKP